MLLACNNSNELITLEYGGLGEAYSWRSNKEELKRQLIKLSGICNS